MRVNTIELYPFATGIVVFLMAVVFSSSSHSSESLSQGLQRKDVSMNVLVLVDSDSPAAFKSREMVLPYLDHFGIPYSVLDIKIFEAPDNWEDYSLVIMSHSGFFSGNHDRKASIERKLLKALDSGCGVVSFDQGIGIFHNKTAGAISGTENVTALVFSTEKHFITERHAPGGMLRLFGNMDLPPLPADDSEILIRGGVNPLLVAARAGKGRFVLWTSQDWMHTSVLGPLAGLDDCLWQSIVWAAKKPFVMRGLPPLVTMRVDDVDGQGHLWKKSPLYWVETANLYGFKPWLGLFIYNLRAEAVDELRGYILSGNATSSPHALGRPPRNPDSEFYYYLEAISLTTDDYDEFIFFDHARKCPYPDAVVSARLKAVDDWYEAHRPLPMSSYMVAHWYEVGSNTIHHVADRWGMDFVCQNKDPDLPWDVTSPWIKGGPFRLYEEPGTSTKEPEFRGNNPVYYADFVELAGRTFFNCFTEIRDDAGYEWSPDNDVKATVGRGVRQLKRALDSMALAVLFTHETDYIYSIEPDNWDRELRGVSEGIADYNPVFLTMDNALKIVRACKTSRLVSCDVDTSTGDVAVSFSGTAGMPTGLYLFTERGDEIISRLVKVPAFDGGTVVHVRQ